MTGQGVSFDQDALVLLRSHAVQWTVRVTDQESGQGRCKQGGVRP